MSSRKPKAAASADVVVVGSFNQDLVWQTQRFPRPGETRLGRFSGGPGGKGFNQAVAAARLGAATCFIAACGRDSFGDAALALAAAERIDARWLRVAGEATGTAAIWLDGSGQNQIVVAPGANALLTPAHVLAQTPTLQAAKVLLTQHEVHPVASLRALEIARAAGVICIHNPAPPLEALQADAMLAASDIVTPNESEFAALLLRRDNALDAARVTALSDDELHALARRLDVPTVVLTLGAGGVFVSHADPARRNDRLPCYRLAAEPVHVVDTTGAGDAFNGGLAAALAERPQAAFRDLVAIANQVAGFAVEQAGAALAMPHAADLRRRFAG